MNGVNYRDLRFKNNVELFSQLACTPENGIPIVRPEKWVETEFVGFNFAKTAKRRQGVGVHFFLDDYQFERIWTQMPRVVQTLKDFDACTTPDFSTYTDWPLPVQKWNHYRNCAIGAYMQSLGMRVYFSVMWTGDDSSFDWCFEGAPVGGCVAVSAVGTQRFWRREFMRGYDAMLERLQPETIIFYGPVPKECRGSIVRVKAFQEKWNEAKMAGW